jgi:hypothetical protein
MAVCALRWTMQGRRVNLRGGQEKLPKPQQGRDFQTKNKARFNGLHQPTILH